MRDEYDFSKSKKNPYARQLKQQVTILLDKKSVSYFKKLATKSGVAYQVLINLYLKECVQMKKELSFEVKDPAPLRTHNPVSPLALTYEVT